MLGDAITHAPNDPFGFEVAASDPVLSDALTARLLIAVPYTAAPQTLPLASDIQLVTDSSAKPNENGLPTLTGTFGGSTGTKFCSFFAGDVTQVFIAVTNKTFNNTEDASTPNDDEDLDEVSWTLTCTQ